MSALRSTFVCLCFLISLTQSNGFSVKYDDVVGRQITTKTTSSDMRCGVRDSATINKSPVLQSSSVAYQIRRLFVELLVFIDYEATILFGSKEQAAKGVMTILTNGQDLLRKIDVHVILKDILFIEKDVIKSNGSGHDHKDKFQKYLEETFFFDFSPYDAIIMFTGHVFQGLDGVYVVGGICQQYSFNSGLVGVADEEEDGKILQPPSNVGITFAHEIGHGLGINHDNYRDPRCCNKFCIMCGIPPCDRGQGKWSQCSREELATKKLKCLSKEHRENNQTKPFCGNGIIEEGEECDCLSRDKNCENCCDARCKELDPCVTTDETECIKCSSGICCDNSCVSEIGTECGDFVGDCYLGGFCDGETAEGCKGSLRPDNTSCTEGRRTGRCHRGHCLL